jgi:predicted transposase/invertase (TIGR01784 family)
MDKIYQIYDRAYHQLFSNHILFKELLESFVNESWVKSIDYNKLEKIDKTFISEKYEKTESDIIYKVIFDDDKELYIYVLLEFQSSIDKFMPLRCLNYITGLYLELIKEKGKDILLPPIFPLVLYNGDDKWNHSVKINDFVKNNNILGDYGINFQIYLLRENGYSLKELLEIGNIVSTLFIMEAHYDLEIIYEQVSRILDNKGITTELKLFLNYFHQMSINEKVEEIDYNKIEKMYKTKEEVNSMFLTQIRKEKENIRLEGKAEGKIEGKIEGQKDVVLRLLNKKFKKLPKKLEAEINKLDNLETIEKIVESIFEIDNLSQVSKIIEYFKEQKETFGPASKGPST